MSSATRAVTKQAIVDAHALLKKSGCSEAEADLLIKMSLESPPRGARPHEAVTAVALAMSMNPAIREHLVDLAHLPKDDRERVQELAAFETHHLPRFNVGFPHCADEFFETMRAFLRGLWSDSHESCLDGAMMVGVLQLADRWSLNPFAIVKCMRETAPADRSMRFGHGR